MAKNFENFNVARNAYCFDEFDYNNQDCRHEAYPYRISPQNHFGLEIVLKMYKNHSSPCTESERGHKISFHLPSEQQHAEDQSLYVSPNENVNVAIKPYLTITDEDLRSYMPIQRKCFFDGDKYLKYFQYYTERNCQKECHAAATEVTLNCSIYFMPRIDNTSICNSSIDGDIKEFGKLLVLDHNTVRGYWENSSDYGNDKLLDKCVCFPSCKELVYSFTKTCTNCNPHSKKRPHYTNEDIMYYSKVKINFKYTEIIPLERRAIFGPMDFIAYCGGLLGLFIGFF